MTTTACTDRAPHPGHDANMSDGPAYCPGVLPETYNALKVTIEYRHGTPTHDAGIGALERTYAGQTYADAIADLTRLADEHGADLADIMRITIEPRKIRA